MYLYSSARNEEPLVDASVDGCGGKVLAGGDGGQVGGGNPGGGTLDRGVCQRDAAGVDLAVDEALPGLGRLADNVKGVLLVLALAGEGELVLGLAIGDLVNAEPLVGGTEEAGEVALNVLNVCRKVVSVDCSASQSN